MLRPMHSQKSVEPLVSQQAHNKYCVYASYQCDMENTAEYARHGLRSFSMEILKLCISSFECFLVSCYFDLVYVVVVYNKTRTGDPDILIAE